ncbi:MAG: hypothetical protein Q9193_001034 [Seirophora villosa]
MPDLRTEGDHSPPKPVIQHPNMPIHSPVLPTPQQRKHWAKQYRTEIAASSSSLLSTFAAPEGCRVLGDVASGDVKLGHIWPPTVIQERTKHCNAEESHAG